MRSTRYFDIEHSTHGIEKYELGTLSFLPNLSAINFPDDLAPLPRLLSAIASHPQLRSAHWETVENTSFLTSPSSPAAALSRMSINNARLMLEGNRNRVYSSAGDISVGSLTIQQMTPPKEFLLMFSNLSAVAVYVRFEDTPQTSQTLHWFPAFLERHPKLTSVRLALGPCDRALKWQALKDVPFVISLYDAARHQRLLSSFSLMRIAAKRQKPASDNQFTFSFTEIEIESSFLDVIRCVGSHMPVSHTLVLKFRVRWNAPATIPIVRVGIDMI